MDQKAVKTCTKCKLVKLISYYNRDKYAKDGYYPSCRSCNAHKRVDRIKKASYDKQHRKTLGLKKAANQYKVTEAYLIQMLADQKEVCAICKLPETNLHQSGSIMRLAVDHCHTTGKVRGFLCQKCNQGLGMFRDNPVLLRDAIEYLSKTVGR